MNFAKYWYRAENKAMSSCAYGWSDVSMEEATQRANARLVRVIAAFTSGKELERYSYVSDGLIMEPVIEERALPSGGRFAITRNAYGALVMNIDSVLFIDIDVANKSPTAGGFFKSLFGKKEVPTSPVDQEMEQLRSWQRANPAHSLVCYRTHSGLRAVVVDRVFDPAGEEATQILDVLCNDPLYRTLCRKQQCFRARLTPKPWRIGLRSPTVRYPFANEGSRDQFNHWQEQYLKRSAAYGICEKLETLGSAPMHPDVAAALKAHDAMCCRDASLPLA